MARGRPSRETVYRRLDSSVAVLGARFGGLPSPEEARDIWSDIWHMEAHHSTALEGNTLVLRQVSALLDEGRTVGARPLKDYLEVKGYGQAAEWVYSHALRPGDWNAEGLIALREIRHIHQLAMAPVWEVSPHPDATEREAPGMFREHDLYPFGAGMVPPSWALIPSALQDWLDLVREVTPMLTAAVSAARPMPEVIAELHNKFERVHPFIDGNGRTGRLVVNLMLVRLGYPPAIILKSRRDNYISAMQRADADDFSPLGEMLARAIHDNINRFILPAIAGEGGLVPLAALVSPDLSLAALTQAAQRGRLEAIKGPEGTWQSTKRAVSAYQRAKGKHRRG